MAPGSRTDELTPRIERLEVGLDSVREEVRTLRSVVHELRGDSREFRRLVLEEFRSLREQIAADNRSIREELSTLHGRLALIGFGLVGSVLASAVAVIVAISS